MLLDVVRAHSPVATVAAATPIAIGDQFGWFHAASGARHSAPRVGVVLCSAFGVEMMCAHKGWRLLAERLAASGLPTLRFDYQGTGDSPGDDREPDRIGAWRRGIHAAIDSLRAATGVEQVTLVGLRLGALLAATVAETRDDIVSYAALAPVVSGRAYTRELGALSRLGRLRPDGAPPDADEVGGISVNGFFVSDETQATLKQMDARRLTRAPARRILIVGRSDGADADLAQAWRSQGVAVETASFDGYDAFMDSPTTTVAPDEVWRRVVAWCAPAPTDGQTASTPLGRRTCAHSASFAPPHFAGDGWTEDAVNFGSGGHLFGILTRPADANAADDKTAVVLLNAGRNHHIGWGRGAVEMARDLARTGVATLRIDAAGIGDSPAWPDGPKEVLYAPEQKADLAAALDRLNEFGFTRVVLVGSCGGAYLALHGAMADDRVAGFALINLLRFQWGPDDDLATAMGQQAFRPTESYVARLTDANAWRRILRGEIAIAGIAGAIVRRGFKTIQASGATLLTRFGVAQSETAKVESWFRWLAQRGLEMMLIYSAEDPGLAELAHYLGPGGRRLREICSARIEVIPNADHNLSQRDARVRTLGLIKTLLAGLESTKPQLQARLER